MDTTQIVAIVLVVGGLLPLLTSVVQQPQWSKQTRTVASVGVSILAGLVAYVTQFGLNLDSPEAIVSVIVGIILTSTAAYNGVWKPSGAATSIEVATSPTDTGDSHQATPDF